MGRINMLSHLEDELTGVAVRTEQLEANFDAVDEDINGLELRIEQLEFGLEGGKAHREAVKDIFLEIQSRCEKIGDDYNELRNLRRRDIEDSWKVQEQLLMQFDEKASDLKSQINAVALDGLRAVEKIEDSLADLQRQIDDGSQETGDKFERVEAQLRDVIGQLAHITRRLKAQQNVIDGLVDEAVTETDEQRRVA